MIIGVLTCGYPVLDQARREAHVPFITSVGHLIPSDLLKYFLATNQTPNPQVNLCVGMYLPAPSLEGIYILA